MRKYFLASVLCFIAWTMQCQERVSSDWGIGINLLGPSIDYPTFGLEGWKQLNDRMWLKGGLGFGVRSEYYSDEPFYRGSAWRYNITAQICYDVVGRPYFSYFVGAGPYWMELGDELGKGFIYNLPEGAMTAHAGADFKMTQLGLLTTTGVRFIIGKVTLGTQFHIPVYFAKTSFSNVQDPLLVVDFKPHRIRPHQEKISEIRASGGISFHFGFAFGGK